jgi:hypothetical protein
MLENSLTAENLLLIIKSLTVVSGMLALSILVLGVLYLKRNWSSVFLLKKIIFASSIFSLISTILSYIGYRTIPEYPTLKNKKIQAMEVFIVNSLLFVVNVIYIILYFVRENKN